MNAHVPQSLQTAEELRQLCAVSSQIVSPRECKPIISIVQDIASGVYRMTKNHVRVSEKQLFNLMCPNPKLFEARFPQPEEVRGKIKKWTGRQLLSTIMPEKVNVYTRTDAYDESKSEEVNRKNNCVIEVKNGLIVAGTFSKDVYQAQSKGIIHQVFNEYGPDETRYLFDNTQQLVCNWLVLDGFSVGISDMVLSAGARDAFKEIIYKMKVDVYNTIAGIHKGTFENKSTKNTRDYFEETVNTHLNGALKEIGQKGNSEIDEDKNRLINMIKSKSKGQMVNVAQMIGCVGQQNVDGKRIPYGFDDRTLPHYTKYDDGPESRGFIQNSFIAGLSPQEFFFAAMGGREGLIDTAVQSVTGDTTIIILEDGKPKYTKIGDWIDGYLQKYKDTVRHFEERRMELLDLQNKVFIPTTDYDGNVTWGHVSAMTRHDPGQQLYKIKTSGGKSVIVTESKSLLIWHEDIQQFKEIPTAEVIVGAYVPVTAKLQTPPVVITQVDMTEYFPKTDYIHGTDYLTAQKLVTLAMSEAKNGDAFTLPDVFDLSYENGVFIGLYLAEGSCCVKNGTISIANNDNKIQEFVKTWFDKFSITHVEDTRINKIGGTSSSVIGHSTLLARFLDMFVGHDAQYKYVPDVAFVATDEFIQGLLNGYISGDGTVGANCIEAVSTSERLMEGISMLCTRLGIFGKVFTTQKTENNLGTKDIALQHRIAIRGQWASAFAKQITLVHQPKNEKLQALKCSKVHRNFKELNDVVLDKIVSIEILDAKDYPKVYDLTIPSTLNFGLANGLQVRDTSETGYIQRKLVKAMEDCKVNYDLTVRNASGNIIQYLYGEDGADATKVESQNLPYINMTIEDILMQYGITDKAEELKNILKPDIMKDIAKDKTFGPRMAAYMEQLLEDREHIIIKMFNGEQESRVYYPVAFHRILTIASNMQSKHGATVISDLDPRYILDEIEKLCDEIVVSKHQPGNKLFHMLVRLYLNPKQLILKHKISKNTFDFVIQQIKYRFFESLAHPSEMVGVIAAQSIGEPATQLSVPGSSTICVTYNGKMYKGPMGKLIDKIIDDNPDKVVDLGHGSQVMKLNGKQKQDIQIIGVSSDEKTSWRQISEISRHPANGNLVKATLRTGRSVTATLTHSFLKRTETGIEPVEGKDLKIGDRMPVAKYFAQHESFTKESVVIGTNTYNLDKDFGWLCGAYIADGYVWGNRVKISKVIPEYQRQVIRIVDEKFGLKVTINLKVPGSGNILYGWDMSKYPGADMQFDDPDVSHFMKNNFETGSHIKKIPGWVYTAPIEFVQGLIGGYIDGDGNIEHDKDHHDIRTHSVCEELTDDMMLLLGRLGMWAHKGRERHLKEEGRNDLYAMHIPIKYARKLYEEVGLIVESKNERLKQLIEYVEREDAHSSQEYIDKIPEMENALATIGKALELEGQSRLYKRYQKKESIGRATLENYAKLFEKTFQSRKKEVKERYKDYKTRIEALEQFMETAERNNRGIMKLPEELGESIAHMGRGPTRKGLGPPKGCGAMAQWNTNTCIGVKTLEKFIDHFTTTNQAQYIKAKLIFKEEVEPAIQAIRRALDADVIWDEIVDLEIIKDSGELVYDFTVPGNDSFMVNCGVLVHNTLNTFHLSGISAASKAVRGVPRLNELLSVSKSIKAPIMKVFLHPDIRTNPKQARLVMNEIHTIRFKDIVIASRIYFDPNDFDTNIPEDRQFIDLYREFTTQTGQPRTPWLLRLEFDRTKVHEFGLDMITLYHILDNFYDERIHCVFSDDNSDQLIMRVKIVEDSKDAGKEIDHDDLLTDLKALEHNILENVVIRGVKNVERASVAPSSSIKYNVLTKQFEKTEEWIVYTDGSNLKDILALDVVDAVRTVTNDVVEVYEVLGVEAARQTLYNEIVDVLDNIHVNYRHIALLVDVMTNKGSILSVNRHGINRGDIGPLAKCSFEETTDKLIKAGIFAEYDKINGVAANVMLGQVAPAGTGDVQILIDEAKLSNKVRLPKIREEDDDELEDAKLVTCSEETLDIRMNIPAAKSTITRKIHNEIEVI